VLVRVAGADGLVDKSAPPAELFEAIRVVARGGVSLPPIGPKDLEAAAGKVDDDDLALLAMLMDRTSPNEVADALHLDRRKLGRRIERLLGRLRGRLASPDDQGQAGRLRCGQGEQARHHHAQGRRHAGDVRRPPAVHLHRGQRRR
jgi:hypothetical protein